MRCPLILAIGLACCGLTILPVGHGAGAPLQVPEIGLMLRGGYTSAEVLQEVATRHVVDPLDAAGEKTLREAGADDRLIEALKSGRYTLGGAEADEAKQRQDAIDQRVQADRAAGQDRLLEHAKEQAQAAISRRMANLLRGKLVVWKDGRLQPYDDNVLSTKKVFAFYYSASWCGPCQKFTPWLVEFYRQFAPSHSQFEVVFISKDRSAAEMQQYMQTDGMPWPALDYAKIANEPELTKYCGPGIPCLVLLDGAGGVHSDSYAGDKYLGPRHVIADLARMAGIRLTQTNEDPPAASANAAPPVSRSVSLSGQPQ